MAAKPFEGIPGTGTLLLVKSAGTRTLILEGPMRLQDGRAARLFATGNPKSGYSVQIKEICNDGQSWPTLAEFKLEPFEKHPRQQVDTPLGRLLSYRGTTRAQESCIRVNQKSAVKF